MLWLPPALTLAAVTLMILGLARPRIGRDQTIVYSEGIAIELVVDRSGSMRALDFQIDGNHVNRLTALKNVASKFVLGEDDADEESLPGRISDLIGLVVFAGYADAVTPLTLDHAFLTAQLNATQIVRTRDEDGTAIGDAISLAVEKLSTLDQRQGGEPIKSKIIILLTDGENTAGEIEPLQAAELAATMGIKVYTIGVGTKGRAPFPVRRTPSGQILVQYEFVNIDEKTLREIADLTGGKYFRATDTLSLESIYQEIDQLEKTKVETQQFVDYKELAIQPSRVAGYRIPPLLLIACCLVALRIVLSHTLLRELDRNTI
jgi:Ca-activated chloride channel family protein